MKDIFTYRFFSRSGIIVLSSILILSLINFFFLNKDEQLALNYHTMKPVMGISLICAFGTFLTSVFIMFHKHKLVIVASVLTLIALGYLKFIVLA